MRAARARWTSTTAFRYAWELVGPDGTVALTGLDVGELAGDGRVRRISGFFGELEPAR